MSNQSQEGPRRRSALTDRTIGRSAKRGKANEKK